MSKEENQSAVRRTAAELHLAFEEEAAILSHPIIIAMKGHGCTGRRLVAFALSAVLRCPLIKEDDIATEEPNQLSSQVVCRIAASQLEVGLSVVFDSPLGSQSQFNQLRNLSNSTKTPLVVIECQPGDESVLWRFLEEIVDEAFATWWDKPSSMEDLHQILAEFNTDCDLADVPKVDITPIDTDINECVSSLLQSISTHVEAYHQPDQTLRCDCHAFEFCDDEQENNHQASCNKCLQKISGRMYKCRECDFIFHKSCIEFPRVIGIPPHTMPLYLKHGKDYEDEVRCSCCKEILKGYFYENSCLTQRLDLNCVFLPFQRRLEVHEHELDLCFKPKEFICDACGILSDHQVCYKCYYDCEFKIDPHCALLPKIAEYKRHRHPFTLSLSPVDETDEYYCDACEKRRYANHWIYYCAECEYAAHTRCIVPEPARPTPTRMKHGHSKNSAVRAPGTGSVWQNTYRVRVKR